MLKKNIGRKTYPKSAHIDYPLFITVLALLLFGVIMVYDASVVYATNVFGGKYHFLLLQGAWVAVGLVLLLLASKFDYHHYFRFSKLIITITFILLAFLALPHIPGLSRLAPEPLYNMFTPRTTELRVYRWLLINPAPLPMLPLIGRFSFQVTDFTKISAVIFLAAYLAKIKGTRKDSRTKKSWHNFSVFIRFFVLFAAVSGLVILEPDFGTAVIIALTLLAVYFFSEAPFWGSALTVILSLFGGLLFIITSAYRRERLFSFLNHGQGDNLASGYHLQQVLIALGSGGLTGLGFGQSRQKYEYLPEVATDSIFAVVGEELGFIGALLLLAVLFLVVTRGLEISKKAPDEFGRLLAGGLSAWLAIQFIINIAAMTRLLPLTGVPLPFISYGGSSMVGSLISVGILLNISRQGVRNPSLK